MGSSERQSLQVGKAAQSAGSLCTNVRPTHEDECRIRKDNAPENFAVLRQIAVNILGQEKRVKLGIKNKQFLAAMDNKYLERLLD
ncbi:hypothetical protein BV375_25095 [Nostoc sp. 106C]|nr:hypothetical protein BV375_25095 [Nostoc sp. 106C]